MSDAARTPADEAAEWFARLRSGILSPPDRDALEQWLAASPNNRDALHHVRQLWGDVEAIRAHPDMLAMREQAVAGLGRRRFLPSAGAVAACMVAMLVAGMMFVAQPLLWRAPPGQTYATRIGERSTITLADGSTIILDTDSTVRVAPVDDERRVELVRGRAFFKVAKRPLLPFIVTAGDHSVTALGTQFGVDMRPSLLRVALTEGRVRVRQELPDHRSEPSVDMNAGYELVASDKGISLTRLDPRVATGWLSGRLVFDNAALGDIADELSRYSKRPVVVAGSIAGQRMSAVLPAGNPTAFAASAEALGLARLSSRQDAYELVPFAR